MDIDGLGEENVRRFLDEGLIASIADIYDIDAERLMALEGFGEISAREPGGCDRGLEGGAVLPRALRRSASRASAT